MISPEARVFACPRAEDMDEFAKGGSSNERGFRHEELCGGHPQAWGSQLHARRGASNSLEGLAKNDTLEPIFQKSVSFVSAIPFSPWSRASKHHSPKSHYLRSVILSCAYEA
jgi:hypothetical protein